MPTDDTPLAPQETGDAEAAESARRRAILIMLALAVLMIPLGFGLAQREHYEWVGRGGRSSYPSFGSAFFPRAAVVAFSLPYIAATLLVAFRVAAAGRVTQMVAGIGGFLCAIAFLLPSAYFIPHIVYAVGMVFGGGAVSLYGMAQLGMLVAALATWRRLRRDGETLHRAWGEGSPATDRQMTIAGSLTIAYAVVWVISLAIPGRMAKQRLAEAAEARARATATERAKIPRGAPMVLAWRVAAFGRGGPIGDAVAAVSVAVDSSSTIYASFGGGIAAMDSAGHVRWTNTEVRPRHSRVVPGKQDVLFVGDAAGILYGVRKVDGTIAWRLPLEPRDQYAADVLAPAVASDGSALTARVAYGRGMLYRVAPTGQVMWRIPLEHPVAGPVVLTAGDSAMYSRGGFIELATPDGRTVSSGISRGSGTSPLLLPGGLIGVDDNNQRFIIFARNGRQVGQQYGVPTNVVAIDDTTVLLVSDRRIALGRRNGVRPKEGDDTVVVRYRSGEGHLIPTFAADTLPRWVERWEYRAIRIHDGEKLRPRVIVVPGKRVIVSTGSRVVVLRLLDGSPISEFVPEANEDGGRYVRIGINFLSAPVVGKDGTIYVADSDHYVYALRDTVAP